MTVKFVLNIEKCKTINVLVHVNGNKIEKGSHFGKL